MSTYGSGTYGSGLGTFGTLLPVTGLVEATAGQSGDVEASNTVTASGG